MGEAVRLIVRIVAGVALGAALALVATSCLAVAHDLVRPVDIGPPPDLPEEVSR